MQNLSQMTNLTDLHYMDFAAAYMPRCFPQSLERINLCPVGWGLEGTIQFEILQFLRRLQGPMLGVGFSHKALG